ncbi:unnamed protein product [Pleuronectes platessa]|uniref:Uncharacterized protein n=1 Tax=Pleuronectes platessa TaxID=8262 RepID=A0A9N7UBD2_PLEPL|nr:unnamed protein product [Pleuronectes platessa]
MPTRHRIRHYHYYQLARYRIRHTGSTIATSDARSTNRNPWCGHSGPGSAGDKAKGLGEGVKCDVGERSRTQELDNWGSPVVSATRMQAKQTGRSGRQVGQAEQLKCPCEHFTWLGSLHLLSHTCVFSSSPTYSHTPSPYLHLLFILVLLLS